MPCHALSTELLTASVQVHRNHLFVTGANFWALHAFYGDLYDALDGWYDRFAERGLADGERSQFKPFTLKVDVPSGNCVDSTCGTLSNVKDMAESIYEDEDPTSKAMIDELVEFLDKMCWQLESLGAK